MSKERSISLMALLAIIESLQILIIVMLVFSFIPIPATDFSKDLFPNNKAGLLPNRKMFFLHVWVGAGLLIHAAGLWFLKGRLGEIKTDRLLLRLIMVDGGWILLQLFFVFKMFMYPQSSWGRPLLYVAVGLSLLSRVFWIEVNAFLSKADGTLPRWSTQAGWRKGMDVFILIFLVLGLWIFDQQRLWAVIDLAGNRAYAKQGWMALSPLIKGINYSQALPWLMGLTLVYYGFFYLLLRRVFGSVLLAGCGVLLAVKWQYFHSGVAPDIWQFPLKTIVPLVPDVFFWLCLSNLSVSAAILGFYLAYHFPTGIWLMCGWLVYLAATAQRPVWYFLPWLIGAGILIVFCGPHGTGELINRYWTSLGQIAQGNGTLPFYDCLRGRNFFSFSAQFIIPVIYFVTFVVVREAVSLRGAEGDEAIFSKRLLRFARNDTSMMMIPVSIYGLGLFTAHVWQPSLSNYDSVSGPLVIVLCYWASQALGPLAATRRMIILSLFLIIYAGALLTNNQFGIYPNIWNMGNVNWAQVAAVHQQHFGGN